MGGRPAFADSFDAAYNNAYAGDVKTRKSTSANYSAPPAAVMLASLAARDMELPADVGEPVCIGDFACGAGILLAATAEVLHDRQCANPVHLFAVDVDRAALAKCVSNMKTCIKRCPGLNLHYHVYMAPYGLQPDGSARAGSLEALRDDWEWSEWELVGGEPVRDGFGPRPTGMQRRVLEEYGGEGGG